MKIKKILAQLQQRRVTRVAAIYSAAAWALLQVADVMFPIIGLSSNAITMVLFLALVGFPLSLVVSWIFDVTSQGIKQTSDAEVSDEVDRIRLTPLRIAAIAASVLLFVLVGSLYVERLGEDPLALLSEKSASESEKPVVRTRQPATLDPGRASIAVMPFVNFSDIPDMEHFGDGLAEEILNLLAKLDELSVAARTSSFYFKNKTFDIQTIAKHLGVQYVLEGSVRHSGDKVRVTAQLIDASNGFHLWSETYDHNPSDIFKIQDEIGGEVVKSLQLVLSSESQGLLDRQLNVDPDAYDFYLRGRDYLRRPGDAAALENAEQMFNKAIAMAPDYADAFAGLCDTLLFQYRADLEKERFIAAESACQRAQVLDGSSSAVLIALGNLYRESGQLILAEREFHRAFSVKSTAVDAYVGLAETLMAQEKYALAEQTLILAAELEPNNWSVSIAMGRYLFNSGRVQESVPYFERIDELLPESNVAATNLGSAYFLLGRFDDAASAWEEALRGEPAAALYANLGSSYFFLRRYDEAAIIYKKALALAPADFENWGNLADAYSHSPAQADLAPAAYQQAIVLAEQYMEVNPSDAVVIAALAHYLACLGRREESLENIKLAQQLAKKDMFVYYFSATALSALNEQNQALDAVRTAMSLGYPLHLVEADAGLASLNELPGYRPAANEGIHEDTNVLYGGNDP